MSDENQPFDAIAEGLKALQENASVEPSPTPVDDSTTKADAPAPTAPVDTTPAPAPAAAAPVDTTPAPAKLESKGPVTAVDKGLERLAQERAAFRAEQERLKPYLETLKQFDPVALSKLSKAAQQRDPSAVLGALGLSPVMPPPEPENPTLAEIQRTKAELQELKMAQQELLRQRNMELVQKAAEKTEYLKELGEYNKVFDALNEYRAKYGTLPGETWEESIAMAVESVENQERQRAEAYARVLHKKQPVVASDPAPQTRAEPQAAGTTLTNSRTNAPRQTATPASPKTPEEYQAEALDEARQLFRW